MNFDEMIYNYLTERGAITVSFEQFIDQYGDSLSMLWNDIVQLFNL